MIRAVIDTNVLVSAYLWPGVVSQVLKAARANQFDIVLSNPLIAELEHVLSREKFNQRFVAVGTTVNEVLSELRKMAIIAIPAILENTPISDRDPKDVMLLECAVGGKVDYLVSGDKDLTDLESYMGVTIIKPVQFLEILAKPPAEEAQQPEE